MTAGAGPAPTAEQAARHLLLALLRGDQGASPSDAAAWRAALAEAAPAVLPYLDYQVRRRGLNPPADVAATLARARRGAAAVGLRRRVTLRRLLDVLDDAGIPAIVLKGAALAYQVYPDPTLRPMADLDCWVPPARLDEAAASLTAAGFRSTRVALGVAHRPQVRPLELAAQATPVELHGTVHSLTGLPWGGFDGAWERSQPAELAGAAARVLDPAAALEHLCLHAARVEGLKTGMPHLLDVALLVGRFGADLDWGGSRSRWGEERTTPWIVLSLALARELLHAPVPPSVVAAVPAPRWSEIRALAERQVWLGDRYPLPPAVRRVLEPARPRERLARLRSRLFDHYWRSPVPRSWTAAVADAARRYWYDVRVKLPRYLRAWRAGGLASRHAARAAAVLRERQELQRLLVAAGALSPPSETALTATEAGSPRSSAP